MNIFLTGGTGFIGSHLLKLLGGTDHRVTALRRENAVTRVDIGRAPNWLDKRMDELDAADFAGVDVLVHLASVGISPRVASWQELLRWNVLVMIDMMEKAAAVGVKRVVLAGSFAEYGLSADRFEFIPADAPLLPTSPYAASKAAGFVAANALAVEKGLSLHYLRIFSAYGEGQHEGNFWPSLRAAALQGQDFPMTPGQQIRDFIPVEKVARVFLDAIEGRRPEGAANVGSGSPTSMLSFAETCWRQWGAQGRILAGAKPYRVNEPMRYVPLLADVEPA